MARYEAWNRLIISEDRYTGSYIVSSGLISHEKKEKLKPAVCWCFEEDFLNSYGIRFIGQEGIRECCMNWGPDDSDCEAREFWYFVEKNQEKIRFGLGWSPMSALAQYLTSLGRPQIEDLGWDNGEAMREAFLAMK